MYYTRKVLNLKIREPLNAKNSYLGKSGPKMYFEKVASNFVIYNTEVVSSRWVMLNVLHSNVVTYHLRRCVNFIRLVTYSVPDQISITVSLDAGAA